MKEKYDITSKLLLLMMQREKPVDKMEPGSPHHSSHSLLIIQNICLCIHCIHNLQGDLFLLSPSLT